MEKIAAIITISAIIWYVVDQLKSNWEKVSYNGLITTGVAAVLSILCVYSFNLDMLNALQVASEVTLAGQILTVLSLMTGSSAVAEIIEKVKGVR